MGLKETLEAQVRQAQDGSSVSGTNARDRDISSLPHGALHCGSLSGKSHARSSELPTAGCTCLLSERQP